MVCLPSMVMRHRQAIPTYIDLKRVIHRPRILILQVVAFETPEFLSEETRHVDAG